MAIAVTVTIANEVLRAQHGEAARQILEQFALKGYKSAQLSHAEVGRLLGLVTPMEVDGFLKAHGVYFDYDEEELAREEATSRYLTELRAAAQ